MSIKLPLPRLCPIMFLLFYVNDLPAARGPFKFENVRLKVEGLSKLVQGWWDELNIFGSPSFLLAKELNFLKMKFKEWNEDVFEHLESKIATLVENIKLLDEKEKQHSVTLADSLSLQRLEVKKELYGA